MMSKQEWGQCNGLITFSLVLTCTLDVISIIWKTTQIFSNKKLKTMQTYFVNVQEKKTHNYFSIYPCQI